MQNVHRHLTVHITDSVGSGSTLLIPRSMFLKYQVAIKRFGSSRDLLRQLLCEFRVHQGAGEVPLFSSNRKVYQSKGLYLFRIHFRPYESDWMELRLLAEHYGCSKAKLFVLLFELLWTKLPAQANLCRCIQTNEGVHRKNRKITFQFTWDRDNSELRREQFDEAA